ncbi:hypothetical protein BO83DRAFT_120256 [Aspergillus eucalypticola CBS 122712]|uniref:Uncharacterized protein n=1 Tax=Aspergillus eucalypticola (strain CBS 122712 / IBT 29274) TaxID=1448314 RepID=A0A317UZW7_ASPEC|nr:uncharacterized protein BO83DRAFT_120256 [Aspergillus eucalypticola CBS 122712]PWY65480.1 hypothetical protein BO83DRAFT_120256 [Aspergillus eucalypticola CBS 122712]
MGKDTQPRPSNGACLLMCLAVVKSQEMTRARSTHWGCMLREYLCVTCHGASLSQNGHGSSTGLSSTGRVKRLGSLGGYLHMGMLTGSRHTNFAEGGSGPVSAHKASDSWYMVA